MPAGKLPTHKQFWRIPFAHTFDRVREVDADEWTGYKMGFHGTHLYALYNILYHGRLAPSMEASASGDRGAYNAVYLFGVDYDRYKKVLSYSPWVFLNWPGVAFQCCLELRYRNPIKTNVSGDQTVCHSEDIILAALWVRTAEKSDFVAGQDWICMSRDKKLWDPIMEAHPLDPTSKFANNFDFENCKFILPESATAVSSAGHDRPSTAVSSAGKEKARREISSELHDVDAQVAELNELLPMITQKAITASYRDGFTQEYRDAWNNHALNALRYLLNMQDPAYRNTLKALLASNADYPVGILLACMRQIGDKYFAMEYGALHGNQDVMASHVDNTLTFGVLVVAADSTLSFKSDGGKKTTCDLNIRWKLSERCHKGPERWSCAFSGHAGGLLRDLCSNAKNEIARVMRETNQLWVGVTDRIPPVRPRICVLVWALNEGIDANWKAIKYNPDNPLWASIKGLMHDMLKVFDRVGIVCPGSGEIWGRGPELDLWIRRAIAEVRSAGVAITRCPDQIEKCQISVDGMHLASSDEARNAMADAVVTM